MKKEFIGNFIVLDLRKTYHEKGFYSFKLVLNPARFKNALECTVQINDSVGTAIVSDIKKWGRKIICDFTIDDKTSNGIAAINVTLKDKENSMYKELLTFWIIK